MITLRELFSFSVVFMATITFTRGVHHFVNHTQLFTMFFQPSNLKSTSVEKFALNADTNQVLVSYKSAPQTTYLYDNVDIDAIVDVFLGEITSVGKFVNAYCKGNRVTAITA